MADLKITQLPVATAPAGSELIEIVQGGVNKQTTLQAVADLAGDEHFLGVYTDETALTTAHATASPGDYAYVDAGVASPVELWIWDDDDDEWVQSGGAAGGTWGSITGTLSAQTDLQAALDAKAPLASPTFTGTPAAPTAAAGTNTTQLATTAFVNARTESWEVPFGDESSPITATTAKLTFYWPYDNTTLSAIWAGLTVVQTSGSTFTIDVNKNGTTMLSTKITIDNTEDTSLTAATQPALSTTTLSRGDKIVIDVDQVGDATAKGPKIIFDFTRF